MANNLKFPKPLFLFTLLLLLFLSGQIPPSSSISDQVSDLLSLQSKSNSGVIHLTDHLVSRFITSQPNPRPYTLIIFFDAVQFHNNPNLHLQKLRHEFALLSSSFIANNPDPNSPPRSRFFFCDIEYKESQSSFVQFAVNDVPNIRLLSPNQTPKNSNQMDPLYLSGLAESMAGYIEANTEFTVRPIRQPPLFSNSQLMILAATILSVLPFAMKRILALVNDSKVWMIGVVFVYFFSVSGTMFNIIRKMPVFVWDRNDSSRLKLFHKGSGMQLGAEGFIVGFLFTIVGLILGFVNHVLVKVRNVNTQRVVLLVALFVSILAVREVVYLDNWKIGYRIHGFWPSTWN